MTTTTTARDVLVEAERSLIAGCVRDPNATRFALEHVTGADFYDPRLGQLFDAITTMHTAGHPVDAITLLDVALQEGIQIDSRFVPDIILSAGSGHVDYYARQVADASQKRALRQHGARCVQLAESNESASTVLGHARSDLDAITRNATTGRLVTHTLGELLDGSDEYDWLIPDLLERMDRLVLTGGEGMGKSTFVRQLAVCAAAGIHPTTFHTIDPVKVLVVDAENTGKQWRRKARPLVWKARVKGQRNPEDYLQIATVEDLPTGRLDLTTERDLGAVHRLIDDHAPDLLFIGPLYKLVPKAINSDDDAAPLLAALDGLRARGVALVMEAHAGHAVGAGGERDMRPRGSAALLGWPEFGLGLTVDHAALVPGMPPTVFKLRRWRGDREERAWPDALLRGGDWPWTDERHSSGIGPAWSPSRHGAD